MKLKMMKRYEDGGILEAANQSEDSQDIARSMGAGERNTDEPEYKSFKEAFAAERKAGNKTFEYMGKKYTTDMGARKETAKPAEPAPKPALRAETNDDRAKRFVAKRAAARAEAAANPARGRSGVMMASGGVAYANGGVVKRASAKSHGKAC